MADTMALIAEARQAAFDSRFPEAANIAQDVLHQLPSCLPALRTLAWAQSSLEDDAALDTFQACSTLDPEDPLAEAGQAIWFERHGMVPQALAKWNRAFELNPLDQQVRREIVRLGGELPETPLAEGCALVREGRFDAATAPLRLAAASNPNDVAAPLVLSSALWQVGGKQQAYNLATTVLAQRPQCVRAILYAVAVEVGSGRTLRTRELLARAEQVDPGLQINWGIVQEVGLEQVVERHLAGRQAGVFGR